MGHWISLVLTSLMLGAVGAMLGRAASTGARSGIKSRGRRWGPFRLLCVAVPLLLADIVRHVFQDVGFWPGCGNNPTFSRVNSSNAFPDSCLFSSSEYRCQAICCVPTWLPLPAAPLPTGRGPRPPPVKNASREFAWFPPQSDLFPEGGPDAVGGQFGTIRADGSLYLPPEYDRSRALEPILAFSAPFAMRDDGSRLARGRHEPKCEFGVNELTGACFLVDPRLPYEQQLRALPRRDPELPYDERSNPADCLCDHCTEFEDIAHLSPIGLVFTLGFTYAGFVALGAAVLWNANVGVQVRKVRVEWRALLAAHALRSAA